MNRSIVATMSYSEYEDVLLNDKSLRYSMNKIQSQDHKIGTYEISKTSLSCFDDKIYIMQNRCELRILHNNHALVPDKAEIKRGVLSNYYLKVDDLYNIPVGRKMLKN